MDECFYRCNYRTIRPAVCPLCGVDLRSECLAFLGRVAICSLCWDRAPVGLARPMIRHAEKITVGGHWSESSGMLFFVPNPRFNPRLSMLLQISAGEYPDANLTAAEREWMDEMWSLMGRNVATRKPEFERLLP